MAASYPTSIKSFSTKTDNVDDVLAAHVNDLQEEVVAIETVLGVGKTGGIIQRVIATTVTHSGALSGATPNDDTIPQIGEGNEIITAAITPKSSSNKILIIFVGNMGSSTTTINTVHIHKDSDADAIYATQWYPGAGDVVQPINVITEVDAGSTSARTYKIRCGATSGNISVNGISSGRKCGGVMKTSLILLELKVA